MNDKLELIATYQEKRKLYEDKAWELIDEMLNTKVIFKTQDEKHDFLKHVTIAILGQGVTLHQAFKRIEEAGFATSYNTLQALTKEEA